MPTVGCWVEQGPNLLLVFRERPSQSQKEYCCREDVLGVQETLLHCFYMDPFEDLKVRMTFESSIIGRSIERNSLE